VRFLENLQEELSSPTKLTTMTKRQLRKAAWESIVKQDKTHRQTYAELRQTEGFAQLEIAEIIAKMPSRAKREQNRVLQWIFIGFVSLIVLLRVSVIVVSGQSLAAPALLLLVALGILIPGIAIFCAATYRMDGYRSAAFLFIISILRSVQKLDLSDPLHIAVIAVYVAAIALAFWIPERMKTPYKSSVTIAADENGRQRKVTEVVFEDEVPAVNDLLDSGI
jgi:hypothetical protein